MNRIYKVIWSKVRNSWVVVSEIARNHGKEHSQRKNIPGGGICSDSGPGPGPYLAVGSMGGG